MSTWPYTSVLLLLCSHALPVEDLHIYVALISVYMHVISIGNCMHLSAIKDNCTSNSQIIARGEAECNLTVTSTIIL